MDKYFEITECAKLPFTFYRSNARDTFHIFRLKRKTNLSTGNPKGRSIVDESHEIFGNTTRSKSLQDLSNTMWEKLSIQKSQRTSLKRKLN